MATKARSARNRAPTGRKNFAARSDSTLATIGTSLGSPGLDNIRWLAPVRVGDTVAYRRTITAARVSESKPDIGLVHSRWEATNQRGETVMTMEGWGMFRRRNKAAPPPA